MSNLICLTEIDEKVILHNSLIGHEKLPNSIYCVLTEKDIIIFKKPSDIMSIKRLPLTQKTKITANQNQFSIAIYDMNFTFSSEDSIMINTWVSQIFNVIDKKVTVEPIVNFDYAEVKISRGGTSQDFFILIGDSDYKLYLYESIEYHRLDIVTHEINLKFYTIENSITRSSSDLHRCSKSIRLIGKNTKIKITFHQEELVPKWLNIFRKAIDGAFSNTKSDVLTEIYKNKSNMSCAECGDSNPLWVSINLFITVCINCAGLHRSLGTSYSRIHSIMIDEHIWKDINLIKLLQEIGNEKSNSFWSKNLPKNYSLVYENPNFLREKYVLKSFIDEELVNLSQEEYKSRLQQSVSDCNIFLTLKLWNSMNFHCDSEFMSVLIGISQNSQQVMQEKFLSLQSIYTNFNSHENALSVNTVFQMSYNNLDVINNLFLVSLLNNYISIKIEAPSVTPVELIEIGCIYYDDISLVWYDYVNDALIISVYPEYPFSRIYRNSSNQNVSVNRISFLNQSKVISKNFKFELLKLLLPNHFVPVTEESNLYVNTYLKINSSECKKLKGKFHVTDHNIIFHKPLNTSYNLKKYCNRILLDDLNVIRIRCGAEDIEISTHNAEDQTIIHKYLESSVKCSKLHLEDNIPVPIVKMIEFISFRGLASEGIFRINGATRKINNLFESIEKSPDQFFIDPEFYTVYDVASCLRKYFRSLCEPLIPNDQFEMFRQASCIKDQDGKNNYYKSVVKKLPKLNFAILRRLIELFFMIQAKENRMNSESIALSTSSSLVSFDSYNYQSSAIILKDLIDNFIILFDYTEEEIKIFDLFVKDHISQHPTSLIRTFYVHYQLLQDLKIEKYEIVKLPFLTKDCNFLMFNLNIDIYGIVKNIYDSIFTESSCELWHVLTKGSILGKGSKTIKRLIYFHEKVSDTIAKPKEISHYDSIFVLFPRQSYTQNIFRLYRSEVKLKSDKYQDAILNMTFPDSLTFSKKKSVNPDHCFSLSDIIIYRFHTRNIRKVFIFFNKDGFLKVKFSDDHEFREFLFFYDLFRNQKYDQL